MRGSQSSMCDTNATSQFGCAITPAGRLHLDGIHTLTRRFAKVAVRPPSCSWRAAACNTRLHAFAANAASIANKRGEQHGVSSARQRCERHGTRALSVAYCSCACAAATWWLTALFGRPRRRQLRAMLERVPESIFEVDERCARSQPIATLRHASTTNVIIAHEYHSSPHAHAGRGVRIRARGRGVCRGGARCGARPR